jgi:hypothetical protein
MTKVVHEVFRFNHPFMAYACGFSLMVYAANNKGVEARQSSTVSEIHALMVSGRKGKTIIENGKWLEGITEASFDLQVKAVRQSHCHERQSPHRGIRGHHRGEQCSTGKGSQARHSSRTACRHHQGPRSATSDPSVLQVKIPKSFGQDYCCGLKLHSRNDQASLFYR